MRNPTTVTLRAGALLAILSSVSAHSWVERARKIASNGTMVGEIGYARGFVPRGSTDPIFRDEIPQNILPASGQSAYSGDEILNKFPLDPNPQFPMLEASPGDQIALIHLENGHTTLPFNQPNKPKNRGTIFLYGTSSPKEQERLFDVHLVWNRDGTGGDGRGRLLSTRNYDDGRCYQPNDAELCLERAGEFSGQGADPLRELACQSAVTIPEDVEPGSIYTLYWYWDWPDLNPEAIDINSTTNGVFPWAGSFMRDGQDPSGLPMDVIARNESYSSVIDIKITEPIPATLGTKGKNYGSNFIQNQNVYEQAILEQLENPFQVEVNLPGGSPQQPSAPSSSALASSTVSSPTTTGTAGSGGDNIATVTVTETVPPTTLVTTVYRTVPAGSPIPSQPTSSDDETSTVMVTLTTRVPEPSTVMVTQTTFVPVETPGIPGGGVNLNESDQVSSATTSAFAVAPTNVPVFVSTNRPSEVSTAPESTSALTPLPTSSEGPVFMRVRRSHWRFGSH
ncbi:hypothetical protein S40285_03238 [Stachybotrys chlorohalonatus IBT 40285]|uniref:DUF7492 domain-containing protein n=1 Tax=Stachybotrys chlorohalonatus (strain IBT 40285) TaxID=1283841 RepID=A0A084QNL8_STAC4|nr:hypothetical protein S40285_03238 [Stachybotrys chlorohalonata IBT 40285]